jgi:hypothetical protein
MRPCITGLTLVRNGNELNYPWKQCILQLCQICDYVLVNCGYSTDHTAEHMHELCRDKPKIQYDFIEWDMNNSGDGRELALQANKLLPFVATEWVLYLQADEFIHEKDRKIILDTVTCAPDHVSQIELYRTYFWESLTNRALPQEVYLGRIFRNGTHEIGGDGMHLNRFSGDVCRLDDVWIYHYSRMGSEDEITKRIRNLDRLFHEEESIKTFAPFSYKSLSSQNLVPYNGSHPKYAKEFYCG